MTTTAVDRRLKVLLVEDDPDVMDALHASLEDDGRMALGHATTGEQALAIIKSWHPHLVLLDIMLPGRGGYAVCRMVKHDPSLASTRILLMTALSEHKTMETWRKVGADGFIAKPFGLADLYSKIEEIASAR